MMTAMPAQLARLADQKTIVLTTYRRNGTPVDTPVHIAFDGGRAFARTYEKAYKTRRIRRHPEVALHLAANGTSPPILTLLRPKTVRPVGPPIPARATILDGEDARRAARALARAYPLLHGWLIPAMHRWVYRTRTVHVELTPLSN
jgi:hypothetical protein